MIFEEPTLREAEKELRKRLREVDTGDFVDPSKITVKMLLAAKSLCRVRTPQQEQRYHDQNWQQSFHTVMMTESGAELKLVGG